MLHQHKHTDRTSRTSPATRDSCTSVEEHVSHDSHLGEDLEGVATEHQALDDDPVGVHREQGARGNEVVHSCQAESPFHQGRCLHHPLPTTSLFPKGLQGQSNPTAGTISDNRDGDELISNSRKKIAYSSHAFWRDALVSRVWGQFISQTSPPQHLLTHHYFSV